MRFRLLLVLAVAAPAWGQQTDSPIGVKVRPPMPHRKWGWQFM